MSFSIIMNLVFLFFWCFFYHSFFPLFFLGMFSACSFDFSIIFLKKNFPCVLLLYYPNWTFVVWVGCRCFQGSINFPPLNPNIEIYEVAYFTKTLKRENTICVRLLLFIVVLSYSNCYRFLVLPQFLPPFPIIRIRICLSACLLAINSHFLIFDSHSQSSPYILSNFASSLVYP